MSAVATPLFKWSQKSGALANDRALKGVEQLTRASESIAEVVLVAGALVVVVFLLIDAVSVMMALVAPGATSFRSVAAADAQAVVLVPAVLLRD